MGVTIGGLVPRAPSVNFPLTAVGSGRYLQDSGTATPFPILGRAAWGLIVAPAADRDSFLNDTVAKGFTAIEVCAPITPDNIDTGLVTLNPLYPADFAGNMPFLKQLNGSNWTTFLESYSDINNQAPDFTTTNSAYWANMDAMFAACLARGLLVLFFPMYPGFQSTHQGLMDEMVANGTTKLTTYGKFIADRYVSQPNLVWLLGGDRGTGATTFTSPQLAVETAFVNALLGNSIHTPALLVSAEWGRGSIGPDQSTYGSLITLNPRYANATDINNQAQRAYQFSSPVMPSFNIEDVYYDGSDATVRRQQWWAMISAGGYCTGNNYVYPFDAQGTWKAHLNDGPDLDLKRLNAFFRGVPWWLLVPSYPSDGAPLITSGGGGGISSSDYVAAAAASDGSVCVIYRPPAHSGTFTVKMSAMRGTSSWWWYDPTSSLWTFDSGGLSNSGTHTFTPPGTNVGGATDWALKGIA